MATSSERFEQLEQLELKARILKSLNTKELIQALPKAEAQFETALHEYNSFRDLNYEYVCSATSDSPAVKTRLAELTFEIPQKEGSKGMTVQEKEAWLVTQRTQDGQLKKAIEAQKNILFNLENLRVSIEIAKERLHGMRAVLELRTAQIKFLAEG